MSKRCSSFSVVISRLATLAVVIVGLACASRPAPPPRPLDGVCPLDTNPLPLAVNRSAVPAGELRGVLLEERESRPIVSGFNRAVLVDSAGQRRHLEFDSLFTFRALPPGTYRLRTTGFNKLYRIDTLTLGVGEGLDVTVPLRTNWMHDGCGSLGEVYESLCPWWKFWCRT